jgi:DNA-binding NarL/FixJ family response regulator
MNVSDQTVARTDLTVAEISPPRLALPPLSHALSARQREVLELLHSGLTAKEVAYALSLQDSTVRVHLWQARKRSR